MLQDRWSRRNASCPEIATRLTRISGTSARHFPNQPGVAPRWGTGPSAAFGVSIRYPFGLNTALAITQHATAMTTRGITRVRAGNGELVSREIGRAPV